MTPLRERLLKAIGEFTEKNGYSPTHRELMVLSGASSTSVVAYNLRCLVAAGLVEKNARAFRTVRLTEKGREVT